MEEEVLFWSRLNGAMSSFCHQMVVEDDSLQNLVSSLVGDDLEWCGPLALSYTNRKFVETQSQCQELNMRCKFLENSLSNELLVVANLRNKLKQSQTEASDNEWRLQEQIAQLNSALVKEKSQNQLLEMRAAINTTKRFGSSSASKPVNIREDADVLNTSTGHASQHIHNFNNNNNQQQHHHNNNKESLNNASNKSNVQLEGKENNTTTGKITRKNSGLGFNKDHKLASSKSIIAEL